MANDPESDQSPHSRRSVRFWVLVTLGLILGIFAGSQIARCFGQDVDWYTGFGQWLGALGSLVAAFVALGIATTDRKDAAQLRDEARREQYADSQREAALVRVAPKATDAVYTDIMRASHGGVVEVRNRRSTPIFDIEVSRIRSGNTEWIDPPIRNGTGYWHAPGPLELIETSFEASDGLSAIRLGTDHHVVININQRFDKPLDYAAISFTAADGQRWKVDSSGNADKV